MSEHDERDDYDDEPWRKVDLERMVRRPADILVVFGMIQLGFSVISLVWFPIAFAVGLADLDPSEEIAWYEIALAMAAIAVAVTINWIVVRGAKRMRSFRSYRLAICAAIFSFLPQPFFYCCMVTAPVAIWALVVLLRPDVRDRFKAVACATITETPPATTES